VSTSLRGSCTAYLSREVHLYGGREKKLNFFLRKRNIYNVMSIDGYRLLRYVNSSALPNQSTPWSCIFVFTLYLCVKPSRHSTCHLASSGRRETQRC
jgi:hypothetical protein